MATQRTIANTQHATDQKQHRLKVLISAYACEPNRGSEPGVGWNMVKTLAENHELWVLVSAVHRDGIEQEITQNPMPDVHFIYLDVPFWRGLKIEKLFAVHYYLWQFTSYKKARELSKEIQFDLGHHVTYVKYWSPSLLAFLGLPFVWGPVGGGESAPFKFYTTFVGKGRLRERIRTFVQYASHFDPFVRLTARRASAALATTEETAARMRQLNVRVPVHIEQAIAMSEDEIERLQNIPIRENSPFRVLSIGRLLDWKGFHFGIEAFARLQQDIPESEYWIIGDGPYEATLKQLAQTLGVADKVRFLGKLSRDEVLQSLSDCDALVHPSLHESGGTVCLEAMSAGRPVICLDLGGPAIHVTEASGFAIPANTPEQAIADLAKAMHQLASDSTLLKQMSDASRQRVQEVFTWDKKGERINSIYNDILKVSE